LARREVSYGTTASDVHGTLLKTAFSAVMYLNTQVIHLFALSYACATLGPSLITDI
jgi:hypothetical protein